MRGRKPIPEALKKLAGNPGKRPLGSEPKVDGKAPACPKHLNDEAQKAWEWLCQTLKGMGILASSDVAIMSLYCDTWAEYVEVRGEIEKFRQKMGSQPFMLISPKTGNAYMNPLLNAESMLRKQLMQYLAELGFSPVSRARIKVLGDSPEDDPLLALMRRRQEHFRGN